MADFLKIYEKFKTITAEKHLIEDGDAVLAAVSGGRDSTAMLLLLKRLASEKPGIYPAVFHFNHCLRGAESDGDAEFVRELSKKLGIECFSEEGDVGKYAAENKLSIETAARELRYRALRRCAKEIGEKTGKTVKIAVAHTAEDRAETVFLNIVRGTSVDGLEGIKYVNGDVIRPLLDLTKEDVETVCRESDQCYRTDSTNFERIGKRNVARLDVFPYIDGKMDCDITSRLLGLSKHAADDADFIAGEAEKAFEQCAALRDDGGVDLFPEMINALHVSLRSRVVRKAISLAENCGVKPYRDCVSVTADMADRTMAFLRGGRGTLELGKGVYCIGSGGSYTITAKKPETDAETSEEAEAAIPDEGRSETVCGGYKLTAEVFEGSAIGEALEKASVSNDSAAAFDLDKLKEAIDQCGEKLLIRAPAEGDRIRPFGAGGGKSLGKFLTDRKIKPADRRGIRLLALGKDAVHVFGLRRSDVAPVDGNTKKCILFELKSEN